jgi:phage terminase Nu1 subunit (DNA packaging protein)
MKLTAKQLAEFYGVEDRTVTNWVNSDPPCPSFKEGKFRFFDSASVAVWKDQKAVSAALRSSEPVDFEKAKARKMTADAALAELELARVRGEQIPVDAVRENMRDIASRVRAQLLAIPGRYAVRTVGLSTLPESTRVWDVAMRDVLNELKEG